MTVDSSETQRTHVQTSGKEEGVRVEVRQVPLRVSSAGKASPGITDDGVAGSHSAVRKGSRSGPSKTNQVPGEDRSHRAPAVTRRKSSTEGATNKVHAIRRAAKKGSSKFKLSKRSITVRSDTRRSHPKITKKVAIANRHARVLEQMLSAPSPACGCLIVEKRKLKKGADNNANLNRKQAISLKKALLDARTAGYIISEVRVMGTEKEMEQQDTSVSKTAKDALKSIQKADRKEKKSSDYDAKAPKSGTPFLMRARRELYKRVSNKRTSMKDPGPLPGSSKTPVAHSNQPMKAFCLDYTEEEAELVSSKAKADVPNAVSMEAEGKPKAEGDSGGFLPSMTGVSPISLLNRLEQANVNGANVLVKVGDASGALMRSASVNEGIRPPLDRMAIFVFWWGFEVTLPTPTMAYMRKAHDLSGTMLNILSTMVVAGGMLELVPYIRYISMTMDMEFKAIQAADQGHGTILAATWLMPLALVPRAWDLSLEGPPSPPEDDKPATPEDKSASNLDTDCKGSSAPIPAQESAAQPTPHEKSPEDLDSRHVSLPTPKDSGVGEGEEGEGKPDEAK